MNPWGVSTFRVDLVELARWNRDIERARADYEAHPLVICLGTRRQDGEEVPCYNMRSADGGTLCCYCKAIRQEAALRMAAARSS